MVIWIVLILHKAGIVEHVFHVEMSWANVSSYAYPNSKKSHLDRVVGNEPSANQQHIMHDMVVSMTYIPYLFELGHRVRRRGAIFRKIKIHVFVLMGNAMLKQHK